MFTRRLLRIVCVSRWWRLVTVPILMKSTVQNDSYGCWISTLFSCMFKIISHGTSSPGNWLLAADVVNVWSCLPVGWTQQHVDHDIRVSTCWRRSYRIDRGISSHRRANYAILIHVAGCILPFIRFIVNNQLLTSGGRAGTERCLQRIKCISVAFTSQQCPLSLVHGSVSCPN